MSRSIIARRGLLGGIIGAIAAPAIVRASSIMPVRLVTWPVMPLADYLGPFLLPPSHPNCRCVADLGITDMDTGVPFIRIDGVPQPGQYSFDQEQGSYSFAIEDANRELFLAAQESDGTIYQSRGRLLV